MPAYLKSAPVGVAGDITRVDDSQVEPAMLVALSGVFAQAFGAPMKYVTGGIQQIAAGDTAASFAGLLVREVPGMAGNVASDSSYETVAPLPTQVQGLMIKGYMAVKCTVGTPVRGGTVYMRVVAASPKNIGDLEATADGGNSVALTNASWATDGKDAFNNAEIRVAQVK